VGFSVLEVIRISATGSAIMLAVMGAASIGAYGVAVVAIGMLASGICVELLFLGIGALLRRARKPR